MKIYLVENVGASTGKIEACFASEEDAERFADSLCDEHEIVERTLFYGQPPIKGYNQ